MNTSPQDIHEGLVGAKRLHKEGRLAEAELAYKAVLKRNPTEVSALHFLGVMESQRGNHTNALSLISKAITYAPGRALFHFNYGVVLHRMGDYEKARESYNEAISLRPQFADAFFKRGELSLLQGDFVAADVDFGQAITFSAPSAVCFQARALARLKLSDYSGALEDLDRIESLGQATFNTHWLRYRVLACQGELEASEAALDSAYAVDAGSDEGAAHSFFAAMLGGADL
jgi:tetratricopeptide (TPR) repeat protein